MPILKAQADLFPAELFEVEDPEQPWWVAHVKSRQEKVLSRSVLAEFDREVLAPAAPQHAHA